MFAIRTLALIYRQHPQNLSTIRAFSTNHTLFQKSKKFDHSRVPTLDEKDLEEQFVLGSGPGN